MTVERLIKILECIGDKEKEIVFETDYHHNLIQDRIIGARNESDKLVLLSEDIRRGV